MRGRDFDSDDAEGLRGHAGSPATALIPERGGRVTGIASRQAGAIAAGALIAGAFACAAPSAASAREMRFRYDVAVLGGVTLGEIAVISMLDRAGYRIENRTRPYRAAQLVGDCRAIRPASGWLIDPRRVSGRGRDRCSTSRHGVSLNRSAARLTRGELDGPSTA